ncbi:MAG: putative tRNA threonylcarbamoyladenosine biosynthesis protein Gcp [candidate division CPR2 bacterium GW2011_GWD2_39_7]|nr:MAG: putative tRNA threonylcarbamoyladenosine biosynthesis protein Gcp [candidate division CPR2 bacterium GW2011_GWD2_39_7]
MIPVLKECLDAAKLSFKEIDALAVTEGPGLIGSLVIGVETAKILAWSLNKPLIPVNHLIGHIYANWIDREEVEFPTLCLVVSGGHTILIRINSHEEMASIGQTRDDAAGEAFDKVAKLLGLGYPGGPMISKVATEGDSTKFALPRAMTSAIDKKQGNYNFSFSGLKTAVLRVTKEQSLDNQGVRDLAASFEEAAVDSLIAKIEWYLEANPEIKTVMLAGGVSANIRLKEELKRRMINLGFRGEIIWPEPQYSTDNAAMIGSAAFYHPKSIDLSSISAFPSGAYRLII